jgi:peptide/nickel transport system ATP-binding protein
MSAAPIDSGPSAETAPEQSGAFLSVRDLMVGFPTEDGLVHAVNGVSFDLERDQTLAIVGESGSGKSVTSQALMGLINRKAAEISGDAFLDGVNLITADDSTLRSLRGDKMAMIFQDPLSSLHPFYTVGRQLVEAIQVHQDIDKAAARRQSIEMFDRVGIPAPDKRIDDYPHQLSGGMRQRVMIAMALINSPDLLIADEPTTALDVTVQAQILELIKDLQREFHAAVIIITHDLGVVAEVSDKVVVMYGGQIVETGTIDEVYYTPEMPYTLGLMASVPRMDQPRTTRLNPIPGQPPSLLNLPSGCVFRPRCTYTDQVSDDRCRTDRPELLATDDAGHLVRCHIERTQRQANAETLLSALGMNTEYMSGATPLPSSSAGAEQ